MISREQVIARLREANFTYEDRGKRAEIWRQKGSQRRVNVALRDLMEEKYVRTILWQAGLTPEQIAAFAKAAIKSAI